MVSSKSNKWATPKTLFNYLNSQFCFTLDPCATKENAKCSKYFTKEIDGLIQEWSQNSVFVNPPYGGHTKEWLEKCVHEAHEHHCVVVCLIVSSTDRSYWHNIIDKEADEIIFLRGRIKFNDVKSAAPFASAIVVFRPNQKRRLVSFVDWRKYHQ
jgi:site-specific DNA-methyltransferase (adenine-specific)